MNGIYTVRTLPLAGLVSSREFSVKKKNLEDSLEKCIAMGGEQLTPLKDTGGHGRYAHIKDPAGAVVALFEPPK